MTLPPHSYLAGFFDGEGSLGIYEGSRRNFSFRVQITQVRTPLTEGILGDLRDHYGGSVSVFNKQARRPALIWQIGQASAGRFLTDVRPWLILKAAQVDIALEWMNARPVITRDAQGRNLPRTEDDIKETRRVAALLRAMKVE